MFSSLWSVNEFAKVFPAGLGDLHVQNADIQMLVAQSIQGATGTGFYQVKGSCLFRGADDVSFPVE
jgi:hypothetical protein